MALFKHNKVETLLGWFHTFGEQCMCMYVCVSWHMKIPFLLLLFHFICNACSSNETQCYHSYQFWLRCNRATSFGLVYAAVVFTGILKSYFSQYVITLLLQCLWRILADKLHKIYSEVRVIKSIASKCRYFHLKWKLFLKSIPVGFIYDIYIYSQWTC